MDATESSKGSKLLRTWQSHVGCHGVMAIADAVGTIRADWPETARKRFVNSALEQLTAWPIEKTSAACKGSNQLRPCTFAHCLWVAAYPCVQWVEEQVAKEWVVPEPSEPSTWAPLMQAHCDCCREVVRPCVYTAHGLGGHALGQR